MSIESLAPQIGSEFHTLPPDIEPLFSIDKTVAPAEGLERLPFVHASALVRDYNQPIQSLGLQQVPLERIVSSPRDMQSWAGEGSVKRLPDGSEESTLQRAVSMAARRSYRNAPKPILLNLFHDTRGEVWCRVVDGSHRIIAAKLNGEQAVEADVRTTVNPAAMDSYQGDIIAEALAKA